MKVNPETMADIAAELRAQNNWGEGAKIQYLRWLTRPGERGGGLHPDRVHQPSRG